MISDNNKISINGSSGFVGKYLKSSLTKNGFDVASLKSVLDFKQTVDYESYLLESLKNTQTIIILGWDTRNRRLDAQIDSMLQTIELIKFCIKLLKFIYYCCCLDLINYKIKNFLIIKYVVIYSNN